MFSDLACNLIKKRLSHRCFPLKYAKLRTPFFTEHLRWVLLFFLKQRSKNEKMYSYKYIHRETPVIVSLLAQQLQAWELTDLQNRKTILDVFYEIFEVLQNLIFTEDSWATASDFQQYFGHITCSISNKSITSQLTVCLGPPQRAVREQFTLFASKIFKRAKVEGNIFCGWGWRNEQKGVFSRSSGKIFDKTHRKTPVQESFFSL